MPNRVGANGQIMPIKGKRGISEYAKRDYTKRRITKPRRNAVRSAAVGQDPEEFRMANVEGSNLERIIYKRLTLLVGPQNVGFIYKFQAGAAAGVDARALRGGIEADFIVLNRPSSQGLVLEPQGAQWHGQVEKFHDVERALIWMSMGYEYAEIMEWEVMLGDEFLDQRLEDLIGTPIAKRHRGIHEVREVRQIQPIEDRPRDPVNSR